MIAMLLRLLPEGPQKEAADRLSVAIGNHPASGALLVDHLMKLRPLITQVQSGQVELSQAIISWFTAYQQLSISDEVRDAVAGVVDAIKTNPEATEAAVAPAIPLLLPMLPGGGE